MDLFVGAAAVSDYRPATASSRKIKKGEGDETLVLSRTPDILAGLGARLAGAKNAPVLVGFAAETEEVIAHAREKLKGKRCDLVVANRVGGPGRGVRRRHEPRRARVGHRARGDRGAEGAGRRGDPRLDPAGARGAAAGTRIAEA